MIPNMKVDKIINYVRGCSNEELQEYFDRVCGVCVFIGDIDEFRDRIIELIISTLNTTQQINIDNLYQDIFLGE